MREEEVMHPILVTASRNERRILLNKERAARASGDWGQWEIIDLPSGAPGSGWCREVKQAFKNRVFCVLVRPLPTGVCHLSVSSLSAIRPTWHEMQRIKNEVGGIGKTAVEVYPPQSEVIDEADMFHIWVLPTELPFSLHHSIAPTPEPAAHG